MEIKYNEKKEASISINMRFWTDGRKDSHRIDYIFYKGRSLKSVKSVSYNAFFNVPLNINGKEILYPSDHGIVVTSFKLR